MQMIIKILIIINDEQNITTKEGEDKDHVLKKLYDEDKNKKWKIAS